MLKTVCQNIISRMGAELKKTPDARKEIPLEWAKNTLKCFEGNQPVCWMGFNSPVEIPMALGYKLFYPELAVGMLAGFNLSADLVEIAEKKFSNLFCCTFHRCSLAAATEGFWPRPTAILGTSNICDGQVKMLSILADKIGIKPVILEVPSGIDEKNIDFLRQQLKTAIKHLEDSIGLKLTDEKFIESIRISNQSRKSLIRLNELRKHRPSPFHGARAINSLYLLVTQLWGLPIVPDLLEKLSRQIEENEQNGKISDEKFRLLAMIPPPTFKTDIYNWLEKEMGAHIVMGELTDVVWEEIDEQNPLRGLADKIISQPMCGTNEGRIDWALNMVRDYQLDGVIHFSHWGCRQSTGGVGILDVKLEEIGAPLLNLDIDLVDPRSFSAGQIYTRIQGFIEMLSQRKEEES